MKYIVFEVKTSDKSFARVELPFTRENEAYAKAETDSYEIIDKEPSKQEQLRADVDYLLMMQEV